MGPTLETKSWKTKLPSTTLSCKLQSNSSLSVPHKTKAFVRQTIRITGRCRPTLALQKCPQRRGLREGLGRQEEEGVRDKKWVASTKEWWRRGAVSNSVVLRNPNIRF